MSVGAKRAKAECSREGSSHSRQNNKDDDDSDDTSIEGDNGPPAEVNNSPDALRLSEILRLVFSYLDNEDLLACTLVNKQWNFEARSVLRDLKRCIADCSTEPCETLRLLDTAISTMSVIPINGLRLIYHADEDSHHCLESPDVENMYKHVLTQLPLKHLNICWKSNDLGSSCPALKLIKKMFAAKADSLESFTLRFAPKDSELYVRAEIFDGTLRLNHLKVLEVSDDVRIFTPYVVFDILHAAPNLQELRIDVAVGDILKFPNEKLHVIKNFIFTPEAVAGAGILRDQVQRFVSFGPRLQQLSIFAPNSDDLLGRDLWDAVNGILRSSQSTLHELTTDPFFLHMLLKSEFYPLLNLEILCLHVDMENPASDMVALKKLDFSRLFPKLDRITVSNRMSPMGETEFHREVLANHNDLPVCCSSVKEICIVGIVREPVLRDLSEIFPGVEYLDVRATDGFELAPYSLFWKYCPQLETIQVMEFNLMSNVNLDADFCGISEEEIQELRQQDVDFLQKVHIVPIRPAITCRRDLRNLHVSFDGSGDGERVGQHDLLFLSKVTGCVAFRQMPQLSVYLTCNSVIEGLNHLTPFCDVD